MKETVRSCGLDMDRGGYFMHGRLPEPGPLTNHLCPNIDTSAYIKMTTDGDCVTAEGLKEGRLSDNPGDFDEVLMSTTGPLYRASSGTCADYDTCPQAAIGAMVCNSSRDGVRPGTNGVDCGRGISGYPRPPGIHSDIINCNAGEGPDGAGIYPASNPGGKAGSPYRYTMPKFTCFQYPPGRTYFDVTVKVGLTAQGNRDGRNILFAGLNIARECVDGPRSPPAPPVLPPPPPPPRQRFVTCPGPSNPRGLVLNFRAGAETVNNLGGYPGDRGQGYEIMCRDSVSTDDCQCGCGCNCTDPSALAPPGTQPELRYSRVAQVFDGSGESPLEADIVVTNLTTYTPWRSTHNGRSLGGAFAQVNLRCGTETTFRYSFVKPGTEEEQIVDYGARALHRHSTPTRVAVMVERDPPLVSSLPRPRSSITPHTLSQGSSSASSTSTLEQTAA